MGLGLTGLVKAEEELAARLKTLISREGLPEHQVQQALAADPQASALSDEQCLAVEMAATSGLFVLTGGPGVGKTTTVRALVGVLTRLERSVALAAPTGKAAKRLGDVVGMEAKTLHRLLGAGPNGFHHWPGDPLPYDAVIVDECSMLDTALARALVRAVGPQSQLILVGDADQLPSIGAGQVLRDLLSVSAVPSRSLTTVFRQAAQSRIVTNAHRIRMGLVPELVGPAALADGVDCIFVPASPSRVAAVGADWAGRLLPKSLGVPASEVQAVAPLIRICQALNSTLQEQLNPARGQAERPHGALPLRVGDRVIQTRNNYELAVFNGDTGIVADIQPDAVQVDFGDSHIVSFEPSELLDLEHAYCLTVHRAQGSEWPGVIVLASSAFGPMLSRSLLYTALTRARKAVVIVGDDAAIARAVADVRDQNRSTGLAALLTSQEP
jgi:exodeoxyribonuclease V alpha subunit